MIFFALVLKHERVHAIFHIICSSPALKQSLAKMQKSTYLLKFFPTFLSFLPRIIHFNEFFHHINFKRSVLLFKNSWLLCYQIL